MVSVYWLCLANSTRTKLTYLFLFALFSWRGHHPLVYHRCRADVGDIWLLPSTTTLSFWREAVRPALRKITHIFRWICVCVSISMLSLSTLPVSARATDILLPLFPLSFQLTPPALFSRPSRPFIRNVYDNLTPDANALYPAYFMTSVR